MMVAVIVTSKLINVCRLTQVIYMIFTVLILFLKKRINEMFQLSPSTVTDMFHQKVPPSRELLRILEGTFEHLCIRRLFLPCKSGVPILFDNESYIYKENTELQWKSRMGGETPSFYFPYSSSPLIYIIKFLYILVTLEFEGT